MKMPVYYVSHGGGPWPWMDTAKHHFADLAQCLADIPANLPSAPRAILMVSAHWESQGDFLIQAQAQPTMLYDYYGFPEHTYHVQYPAKGNPALALHISQLLLDAKIPVQLHTERGYDHGAFVTGFCMYPDANIPMLQLSIDSHYDPHLHLALGQALKPLRQEGVLLVGSGASYHNLRLMGPEGATPSAQFDAWLEEALLTADPVLRNQALMQWEQAPAARIAHAREDHLVPLFVAAGAADPDDSVTRILNSTSTSGIISASYRFG